MSIEKSKYLQELDDRGGYGRLPNEIWEMKIDHIAKIIWAYLVSQKPSWDSSRNNISRNLDIHKDTVSKHVEALEQLNMIKVIKGTNNAWSFEIVPPSGWLARAGYPAVQAKNGPPTSRLADSPPEASQTVHQRPEDQPTLNNRNTINNTDETNSSDFKEKELISNPKKISTTPATAILISWRNQFPDLKFISGKKAKPNIEALFMTLKQHDHMGDALSTTQILKAIFGSNPKPKMRAWIEDVEGQIDFARISAYQSVSIVPAEDTTGESEFISPRAEVLYRQYKSEGKTAADFNGLSLLEYANQRAYSDEFQTLDTAELIEQYKERDLDFDLDLMMKAAGCSKSED